MMREEKAKGCHSRSYDRFYEGFSEKEVLCEDGSVRIEREYTGKLYRRKCSDREWSVQRVRSLLVYLFSLSLYLFWAMQDIVYNSLPLAELMEGMTLVSLICFLFPLYYHMAGKREMIIRVYRDAVEYYRKMSLFAAVCFWILAAVILAYLLLYRIEIGPGIALAGGFAAGGGTMFWLYWEEKQAAYEVLTVPRGQRGVERGEQGK